MPPNTTVGMQMSCACCGHMVIFSSVDTDKIRDNTLVCPDCSYFNPIDDLKKDNRLKVITPNKPKKKKG